MWNELACGHRFSLYCAYPVDVLTAAGSDTFMADLTERGGEATELYIPVPGAVRAARRFVQDRLKSWGQEVVVDDASIVVSELAANAITHASSPFRVSIERTDATVRIAVEDLNPDRPVLDRSGAATAGKGLVLVAALCSRWGIDASAHSKSVWGEIAGSSGQRRSQ